MRALILACALGAIASPDGATASEPAMIDWQTWSDSIFERAQREHRFVLLDLEAVWCHWCHVMDAETYADPKVVALIRAKYLAVKVDQDSRPDISARYEDYGWPATVVFNPDGSEIMKRQGYLPAKLMASMLQAIIDDPSPGPSITKEAPPVALCAHRAHRSPHFPRNGLGGISGQSFPRSGCVLPPGAGLVPSKGGRWVDVRGDR